MLPVIRIQDAVLAVTTGGHLRKGVNIPGTGVNFAGIYNFMTDFEVSVTQYFDSKEDSLTTPQLMGLSTMMVPPCTWQAI